MCFLLASFPQSPVYTEFHVSALCLGIPGPEPAVDGLPMPSSPPPSLAAPAGVGWGGVISRMESHQREANGKEAAKPAPTGLAVDSQVAGGSFPASSREAGRLCCAGTLRSSDLKFPVARLRVSAFLCPRPPRSTQPSGATHVLLHFSQVLLGEERRGSLHGRGRDGVLRPAPPRPG